MADEAKTLPAPCRVLELDPDLAEGIPLDRRPQAVKDCLAREISVPTGRWAARHGGSSDGIGLLVLSGLLIRRVGIDGRFASELLGEGDLLRPWQGDDEPTILPVMSSWRILETTRMALLDDGFMARVASYPELSGKLVGRALARSRNLAINMAIIHHARVDVRLHMLLWHLAGRWGRVRKGGEVRLPLRLTHAVLAEITAARRPTVTSALSELSRRGLVVPDEGGGWLLSGEPPGELLGVGVPAVSRGAQTV
jgi:CRP/FNR family transcriptional regulator, cyclic AMP receptor protein